MAEGFELVSNDGVAFKADWLVVKQSNTLKTMLESFGIDKNSENLESIPLPKINSKVLGKILQYCNHHRNDPPYDETKPFLPDFITNWDAEFFNVDTTFLILLAEAANYLDIKSLSDALSYILISIMKDSCWKLNLNSPQSSLKRISVCDTQIAAFDQMC
ncbi:tetramerization domain protein, skp1 family [Trichinella spiralis]|uniref:tetramerization domain protein, skp1 family n=1 Tax=Trichinella spiralis TaxID=6334 RepID=UPI0001EFDC14|nr:tetramerization domain protein, skp1 family [Trichinella spiralis]